MKLKNFIILLLKATPHKNRLTAWHHICLLFFRHLAQKSLDNRQVDCGISIRSDEKIDCASAAPSLCGVALKNKYSTDLTYISIIHLQSKLKKLFRNNATV